MRELREITFRVTIQPARGKSLRETEAYLRNKIGGLPYVTEIETVTSFPVVESTNQIYDATDFRGFCRQATDNQLENILLKEHEASKRDLKRGVDYYNAVKEAERRGWTVKDGVRQ